MSLSTLTLRPYLLRKLLPMLVLASSLLLVGCRTTKKPPPDTRGEQLEEYVEVQVYYGTDRKRMNTDEPSSFYGGERGSFEVGTCNVSIPKGHRIGQLESPAWYRLQFREDPSKHVVLLEVNPMGRADMLKSLQISMDEANEKAMLVFVHGYNVTFEDAARRTGQLAYDLGFDGVPVMYSWPANGGVLDYPADETDVEWTVPHLTAFLEEMTTKSGADKVHLIAHSMGNRAVTDALRQLASQGDDKRFNQIILTAPDIDADVFARDIIPAIRSSAERVTLYASSADRALQASNKMHQYPRAGESGDHLVVVDGLDTIDASLIDTDMLGHSYFAQTRALLMDLYSLMQHGHPPSDRNLQGKQKDQRRYWVLK